jgi:hypothetical protein
MTNITICSLFTVQGSVDSVFTVHFALQGEWIVTVLAVKYSWLRPCSFSFVNRAITSCRPEKRADVNSIGLNQWRVKKGAPGLRA